MWEYSEGFAEELDVAHGRKIGVKDDSEVFT